MILRDNNPDDWRFYHDKCKRDENVKLSEDGEEEDEGGDKKGKKKEKKKDDKEEKEKSRRL